MKRLYDIPDDFEAVIRIYTHEEGGRRTPPFNGIQWDFTYVEDPPPDNFFMVWPDFFDENWDSLPTDQPLPVNVELSARMMIVVDEMRARVHRNNMRDDVRFFCMEGTHRVAEGRITRITGLFTARKPLEGAAGTHAHVRTGILKCDETGIILRISPTLTRKARLKSALKWGALALIGLAGATMGNPHFEWWQAVLGGVVVVIMLVCQVLIDEMVIARPDKPGIARKLMFWGKRIRKPRQIVAYRDITKVVLEAMNPSFHEQSGLESEAPIDLTFVAPLDPGWYGMLSFVRLETTAGAKTIWYTKHHAAATKIAATLASFARCPFEDRRDPVSLE